MVHHRNSDVMTRTTGLQTLAYKLVSVAPRDPSFDSSIEGTLDRHVENIQGSARENPIWVSKGRVLITVVGNYQQSISASRLETGVN
jgi:hypothetical protein